MDLEKIVENLYSEQPEPESILYHYTSIKNLLNIIKQKSLYASEIRYFSDASELKYTSDKIHLKIEQMLHQNKSLDEDDKEILNQFSSWVSTRIPNGDLLFVMSFTTEGNLLSQWRSYCPESKGVSIGFDPNKLQTIANKGSFSVGKCIYEENTQQELITDLITNIMLLAKKTCNNTNQRSSSQSYFEAFENAEECILKLAALIKSPHFKEEKEWRLVSNSISDYANSPIPIKFREGKSFLIPYIEFKLPRCENNNSKINIKHIYVGPTPNVNISVRSIDMFLVIHSATAMRNTSNSQIPYRTW